MKIMTSASYIIRQAISIAGLPSLCRDSSPLLTFRLWYSRICAEKGH